MADPAEVLSHLDELLARRTQQLRFEDDPAELPDLRGVERVGELLGAAQVFVPMGTDTPLAGPAGKPKGVVLRALRMVTDKQVAYNSAVLEAIQTLNGVAERLLRTTHKLVSSNLAAIASTEAALDQAQAELVALRAEVAELRALVSPRA